MHAVGAELRDGLDRREFVAAKRAAYQEQRRARRVSSSASAIDEVANDAASAAVAITRVELHDRAVVHNRVEMARRNGAWQVVAYRLEPSTDDPSTATRRPLA